VYLIVQVVSAGVLGGVLFLAWRAGALEPGPLIGVFFLLLFVVQ